MPSIKTNERELASKVAQWFNEQIQRVKYPFTSASCEAGVSVGKTTFFGDIIIWKNRETNTAFSYLELKPPFGNKENIERFKKKAIQLKVKYAYTWDFQSLNTYEVKNKEVNFKDSLNYSVLTNINEWKRGDKQAHIKAFISKICDELLSFSQKGGFQKFKPDKHYFIRFLRNTVEDLIPLFENYIRTYHKQKKYKHIINKFVSEQGIAYPNDEAYYKLISRQRVYGLVTKIIFYFTIKRHFTELPDLTTENDNNIPDNLKYAFEKAREIDWQAIFETDPIENLGIPTEACHKLNELFSQLFFYDFGTLPEDVVGEIFEEIIDPKRRHELGQYFTREDLVDLVIATIVNDKDKIYSDPTCGSGTFLIRLYDRIRYLNANRIKHEEILNRIWGFDIGKFPAELSTINLFRQSASNFENFPRVRKDDIFDVYTGKEIEFPPNNINFNGKYNKIKIKIPAFEGLVGNFPYIRQELIEKNSKGYKQKLTKLLAYEYFITYPKLFKTDKLNDAEITEFNTKTEKDQIDLLDHWIENKHIELKLSGKADIYTYIFIHAATLLAKNGSFAIITSNSWLDVSYGSVLKEFFLYHFKIKMIVASWAEPWFDDAAVNTVFTVLERCENKQERNSNLVHFVKLKQKLEDMIPERNLKFEADRRWLRIDGIINTIESAQYKAEKVNKEISSFENEMMRVRMLPQEILSTELKEQNELSKWGKYLRAPDVYFEILEKCQDKLVPLKSIANVRRGITTGINEFFYLQPIEEDKKNKTILCKNSRGWQGKIESRYLKPVIKSPKESDSIVIDKNKLKNLIFICNKSKSQLKKANHLLALKYIEWGETQRTKANKPWPEVPSVKGRKYWWGIPVNKTTEIFWTEMYFSAFRTLTSKKEILDSDKFYRIDPYTTNDKLGLYLNCSLLAIHREIVSFMSLGDGILKTPVYEIKNLPTLKEFDKFVFSNSRFLSRPIEPIIDDIRNKDRQELDKAVLRALGLEPGKYLQRIYDGLTEMVRERLELPKMRKKRKKQKVKVSYEEVKRSVVKEIIGDHLKQFPRDFYTATEVVHSYDDVEVEIYNTSGKDLHIDEFMHILTIQDADDQEIFSTENPEKAEFAIILAKPDIHRIKIPKDEKIISEILQNYRNYVQQLEEQLVANAQNKLHSWNEAEQIAKEILAEFGFVSS